jgi:hypothetical protein
MGEFYFFLQPQAYFVKAGETMTYKVEARNAEEEKVTVDKVYVEVHRLEWEKEEEKWRETLSQF